MLPAAILLRNYRSFRYDQRLELRPLTMIYGRNNAGKSSLVRLLPLLSDSLLPTASGPLELMCPAVRGSTFADLRWKGRTIDDELQVTMGFEWRDMPLGRSDYVLQWFDDWNRLIVRRFAIWEHGDTPQLVAEWHPRPEDRMRTAIAYDVTVGGQTQMAMIGFSGLIPEIPADQPAIPLIDGIARQQRAMAGKVQWLMASRQVPTRVMQRPAAPRWRIKPDGSDACAVLAFHPDIRAEVSSWYHEHLDRVLDVLDVPPDSFRTVLRNLKRADFDIDLVDTGEGMVQGLPVLVALALARRHGEGGPSILAMEEPESHLHPDLQRAVAEHMCKMLRATPGARVVMETHSEHLLLAVQLEIARGNISPDDVLVYWARQLDDGQSIADPVRFDADARPQGNWPTDVFTEDHVLAREILRARRERQQV